jgi:hypothetical protein
MILVAFSKQKNGKTLARNKAIDIWENSFNIKKRI